jgi:hypothetical protein
MELANLSAQLNEWSMASFGSNAVTMDQPLYPEETSPIATDPTVPS